MGDGWLVGGEAEPGWPDETSQDGGYGGHEVWRLVRSAGHGDGLWVRFMRYVGVNEWNGAMTSRTCRYCQVSSLRDLVFHWFKFPDDRGCNFRASSCVPKSCNLQEPICFLSIQIQSPTLRSPSLLAHHEGLAMSLQPGHGHLQALH
jgi:hypothetical protein